MTVEVYSGPGVEDYRSTRFTATVGVTAAYVFGMARTTEFGVTGFWSLGDNIEMSWVSFGSDAATVDVTVSLISGAITSYIIYPQQLDVTATLAGGDVTVTVPANTRLWMEVNGERGEPIFLFHNGLETAPIGGAVTYTGAQTEVAAGTVLYFPAGVHTIGQNFLVNTGGTAHLDADAWLIGSFSVQQQTGVTITGLGVLSGEWEEPSVVQALPTYEDKLAYSLINGYHATFMHYDNSVDGITIVRPPWYSCFEGVSDYSNVKVIAPWWSNCSGITPEGDSNSNNATTIADCFCWSCDDCIDLSEYIGGHYLTGCLLASTASSTLMFGYWPGYDYGLVTTCVDNYIVSVQSYSASPRSGTIIAAWSDGTAGQENYGINDVTIDGLYVEGATCYGQLFALENLIYQWGTTADQTGNVSKWVIRNLVVEGTPANLSVVAGKDRENTPHDIAFYGVTIGGVPLSVRNFGDFFTVNNYPYRVSIEGRNLVTAVDICNLALSHLGDVAEVTAIAPSDGSAQADRCAQFYEMARDAVLEMHSWNFATRRVAMTAATFTDTTITSDNESWDYAYVIPADLMRTIAVLPPGASDDYSVPAVTSTTQGLSGGGTYTPQTYSIEMSSEDELLIYTDIEDAVLRYTYYATDPNLFSPQFVLALSWYLASLLAGPTIKGAEGSAQAARCMQMAQVHLGKATTSDANQRRIRPTQVVSWFNNR